MCHKVERRKQSLTDKQPFVGRSPEAVVTKRALLWGMWGALNNFQTAAHRIITHMGFCVFVGINVMNMYCK